MAQHCKGKKPLSFNLPLKRHLLADDSRVISCLRFSKIMKDVRKICGSLQS